MAVSALNNRIHGKNRKLNGFWQKQWQKDP